MDLRIKGNETLDPAYYQGGIDVRTFIRSHGLQYHEGNIIKYVVRHDKKHETKKGKIEDLLKAKSYLDDLIKIVEEE